MVRLYKFKFLESQPFYFADRPTAADGAIQGSTEIAGYILTVYRDGTQVHIDSDTIPDGNLTAYSAGSPQTDGYWSADSIGYTMLMKIDPANWDTPAEGGVTYLIRIEYTNATVGGVNTVTRMEATAVSDPRYLSGAIATV